MIGSRESQANIADMPTWLWISIFHLLSRRVRFVALNGLDFFFFKDVSQLWYEYSPIKSEIMSYVELEPLKSYGKLMLLCKTRCTLICFIKLCIWSHLSLGRCFSLLCHILHIYNLLISKVLQHLCSSQNTQYNGKICMHPHGSVRSVTVTFTLYWCSLPHPQALRLHWLIFSTVNVLCKQTTLLLPSSMWPLLPRLFLECHIIN